MNQRVLVVWAIGATLVAVGAMGYALGKRSESVKHQVALTSSLNTTDGSGANAPAPAFFIPERFQGLPTEWRSRLDKNEIQGYAVLFDPSGETLIVEDCVHSGYQIDANGRPVVERGDFCQPVAWAAMVSLADDALVAKTRQGDTLHVVLEFDEKSNPPILNLSFDGHRAELVPGSKQDLFVTMERFEPIAKQKEAFMQASVAAVTLTPEQRAAHRREEERRKSEESARQQAAELASRVAKQVPADIPRYVIKDVPPPTE